MPSRQHLKNRLLAALPPEHAERLTAACQEVELPIRMQLFAGEQAPRYLYFLTAGIASLVYTSEHGTTVELATLGNEGLVGSTFLLGRLHGPTESMMQVEGAGVRLPMSVARQEFDACAAFRSLVLQFVQHQNIVANQLAACNRLHKAEARFARWLLMVQDRLHSDQLEMTQEFLSNMLGTRRTTVAEVAAILETKGAIERRRGRVRILDRARLERLACECYPVTKSVYDALYR